MVIEVGSARIGDGNLGLIAGPCVIESLELCLEVAKEFSRCTFFAGKLVLKRETFLDRYLHNQTAAKVEQRLHLAGQHTVVLPLVVTA